MIKEESKKKLCENFRIAKKCSIIACVLADITLFIDLIIFNVARRGLIYDISRNINDFTIIGFLIFAYNIILLIIPCLDIRYLKGKNSRYNYEESPYYSDRVNCRNIIIFNFTEYYLLIIFWFYGLFSGNFSLCFSWARACGYMLFSRIFLMFATIYLIKNYNILKKEFKENPPTYVLKQQENKKDKFYQQFINVCGFKFFIKYYNQIKTLPIKDIQVEENLDSLDKEKRISIIKEMINLKLVDYCCNRIKEDYMDYLTKQEKELIEKIK